MKKIIVTRENYEEIMFDLLENNYPKEVRENILDQIHADTFLSFEWEQWSKASYTESTEKYKAEEALFIESLTREEEKKKGFVYYMLPLSIAASVILLIGIFFLLQDNPGNKPGLVESGIPEQAEDIRTPETSEAPKPAETSTAGKYRYYPSPRQPIAPERYVDSELTSRDTVIIANINNEEKPATPSIQDTIRQMIASAQQKKPRYKITISEEKINGIAGDDFQFVEKRYTMADVLNRKDGISLSKFLQNSNSRVITDPETNKVTIEYIAEDHSILVLTLSN